MNPPARTTPAALMLGGIVVTLPWIGADVVGLLTGHDLGAGFQPAYLLLAGAMLAALPAGRKGWPASWRCLHPWNLWALAALAVVLLSAAGLAAAAPPHPAAGERLHRFLRQLVQMVVMLSFMLCAALEARPAARWRLLLRLLAWGLVLQCAYSVLQAIHFHHPLAWFAAMERVFTSNGSILAGSEELFVGRGFVGVPRVRGTACEPLYLGNYLLLVMPLLLLPEAPRVLRRRWPLPAAAFLLLMATWSRGAWLAAAAAAGLALLLARRSGWRGLRWRGVGAAAAVGVAAAGAAWLWGGAETALLPARRLLQVFDLQDWSNLTRLYSMEAAWRAFGLSPIVGVGWGQFAFHFPHLTTPLGLQSQFTWPVVNNFPLQIICETGMIGAALLVAAACALARRVWNAVAVDTPAGRSLGERGRWRVIAAAAAVFGVWGQLLTFSQYNLPHIWVAPGLLLAALTATDEASGIARAPRTMEGSDA